MSGMMLCNPLIGPVFILKRKRQAADQPVTGILDYRLPFGL